MTTYKLKDIQPGQQWREHELGPLHRDPAARKERT